MSDNHSLNANEVEQLAADATVLAGGSAEDQAQAQNIRWALGENERNQNSGNNS